MAIESENLDEMFNVLMNEYYRGLSVYRIREMTGLASGTINMIKNGKKHATVDVIKAMCVPVGLGLHHVLSKRTKEELETARLTQAKNKAEKKARRKTSKSLIKSIDNHTDNNADDYSDDYSDAIDAAEADAADISSHSGIGDL